MTEVNTPAPATAQEAFLDKLRSATGPMHRALEATALSQALQKDDLPVAAYASYLAYMASIVACCEQELFPLLSNIIPDLAQRRKLPLLEQDLALLGSVVALPTVPAYRGLPEEMGTGFALGYLYVVEGSVLGGRVLLKHIEKCLGYNAQEGARFFAGYGAATGPMWRSFLEVFTGYTVAHGLGEEVIGGSQYAFSSIGDHFNQKMQ
ncbi:MAG: hypothetical protein BGO69_10480 [Bacteroidetes bacterium 46-16]|nr:MAG: hypothetical protein BGO69_10480 [Bacteroidetes bacterium 46-16]